MTTLEKDEPQILSDFEDTAAVKVFVVPKEQAKSLGAEIAHMYEEALGKDGVQAKGHEAYPDSDLFSAKGMKATLEAGERMIAVAQIKEDGRDVIVGAMVADHMSPYHVEFNSMAVPVKRRGLKLGTHIVRGLAEIIDRDKFTVNATELVTHSMASQAAHFHNGFRAICGFGFCHYPHVFFKDHPESVLWVTRFQGALVPNLRKFRSALGRSLGRHLADVKQKLIAGQASGQVNLHSGRLDDEALNLAGEVLKERTVYVPKLYHNLVQAILFQFEDVLDVKVKSWVNPAEVAEEKDDDEGEKESAENLSVELKEGFGHSYIIFKKDFVFDEKELARAIKSIHKHDKRYIKVCIPANTPEAMKAADYLMKQDFVFHSLLPLYGFAQGDTAEFYDILSLQWIKPSVLRENALPGETESVVKLYGYPENLSGDIVKMIAAELHLHKQKHKEKEIRKQ
ncbi:MAG: hypothetical protein JST01_27220 [Cyanobacteria bacterium SZAS TMP-1]|nr:hypothetical protein [Cyanobacteria bacterium SZAS TMP-1]